ncbi:hypothetical protein [Winogradskyella costae]|nr:hypothetical protein [Winogradskyella costae]
MKITSKHLQKQFARVGRIFPKRKFEAAYSDLDYSKLNAVVSTRKSF